MIKKLHHSLAALFAVLSSCVLALSVGIVGYFSCRQYLDSADALFYSTLDTLLDKLQTSPTISDDWLNQQEADGSTFIYIEDNGTPLQFAGNLQPQQSRAAVLEKALAAAQGAPELKGSASLVQTEFFVKGDAGESYRGAAAVIRKSTQPAAKQIFLILLRDQSPIFQKLSGMIALYGILWLFGSAALGGIGWCLVGLALRPTQQALDEQNEFIAAASHELRSPLTVIKASMEAAEESGGILPEAKGFLAAAGQEADRMKLLTDDLLLLAGSDAHVWRMNIAPVPLDTFCIELYDAYYAVSKKQGHTLSLDLPDQSLPTVPADAQRLRQLFAILINNALEYAPPGTPIELHAKAASGHVQLSVADHGRGVPDAEKSHIFKRFYRTDKSRSEKAHFGLGLAVAKEIADMHHARLTVGDTPGGGATFLLELPTGTGKHIS
jgi:OmpR-family two-component system manganese-sensing sensor histidine kinase